MARIHEPSVVVGIDGSESSIWAAQWAADEAIDRSVPLRLISVTKAVHHSPQEYYEDLHHARNAVQVAQAALEAAGKPVKIESEIVDGHPGVALVAQSRDAEMLCVGTVGIGRYARSILGSTATEVAEKAHCPVAVIRAPKGQPRDDGNWIVTALTDGPDNEAVIQLALGEARLRHAPVLILGAERSDEVLGSTVQGCRQRYPDLRIDPVTTRADVAKFIKQYDEPIQLAVIGASQSGMLADIVGSHSQHKSRHAGASVLIVR